MTPYTPPEPFLLLNAQEQTIHWPIPTKIDVPMSVVIPPMNLYCEAQLREEVTKARAAAIEECANEAERMTMYPGGRQKAPAHDSVWHAARAIRALAASPQEQT